MALNCKVDLNTGSYAAGQTPAPKATVTVYNTGSAAVSVTGIEMNPTVLGSTTRNLPIAPMVPPTGPGMTVSVAAAGTTTFGPFDVVLGSAANGNPAQMVNTSAPYNPQPSQPANFTLSLGATVYGSDGTVNIATPAAMLVSYTAQPPAGSQGGYLNFAGPNNFLGVLPGWP